MRGEGQNGHVCLRSFGHELITTGSSYLMICFPRCLRAKAAPWSACVMLSVAPDPITISEGPQFRSPATSSCARARIFFPTTP